MSVTGYRQKQVAFVLRRIAFRQAELVVFMDHRGRLDTCDVDSPRHQAMLASVGMVKRIVGVFGPGASAALLLAAAREVMPT